MKYIKERLIATAMGVGIGSIIPILCFIFSGPMRHSIGLLYFWLALCAVAMFIAFIYGYKIFSKNTSQNRYWYVAWIGFSSALIVAVIMGVVLLGYLEYTTKCGSLSHLQCYGTLQQRVDYYLIAGAMGVIWTSWNVAPLVALLCVWARKRFISRQRVSV